VIKVVNPVCSNCEGDVFFTKVETKKYISCYMVMDMFGSDAAIGIEPDLPDQYESFWQYKTLCEECGHEFKIDEYEDLYAYNLNRDLLEMRKSKQHSQKAGSSGVGSSHDSVTVASTSSTSDES